MSAGKLFVAVIAGTIYFGDNYQSGSSAKLNPEQLRKQKIKSQFGALSGEHFAFSSHIKKSMLDPDSFEHIESRYKDNGKSIMVITQFRGNNAFGGKAINEMKADFDLEENLIRMYDSE